MRPLAIGGAGTAMSSGACVWSHRLFESSVWAIRFQDSQEGQAGSGDGLHEHAAPSSEDETRHPPARAPRCLRTVVLRQADRVLGGWGTEIGSQNPKAHRGTVRQYDRQIPSRYALFGPQSTKLESAAA